MNYSLGYDDYKIIALSVLRENGKMAMDDFLYACGIISDREKVMSMDSLKSRFFDIIVALWREEFILVSDNDLYKLIDSVNKSKRSIRMPPKGGHKVLRYFEKKRANGTLHDVTIQITDYFFHIQETIGFSLTDMHKKILERHKQYDQQYFMPPYEDEQCDVFVIMPFDDDMKPIYEDHIMNVCNKLGLKCKRADSDQYTMAIMNKVWSLIHKTQIVICDCTREKANVYYELGLSHALNKKVVCITQDMKYVKFDIQHLPHIVYQYTPRGMTTFEKELENRIVGILKRV